MSRRDVATSSAGRCNLLTAVEVRTGNDPLIQIKAGFKSDRPN